MVISSGGTSGIFSISGGKIVLRNFYLIEGKIYGNSFGLRFFYFWGKEYTVCCLITLAEYMIKLNRCITYVYSNKVNCYQKSRSISIPEYIIINKIKKLHVYAVIFLLQNTCISAK